MLNNINVLNSNTLLVISRLKNNFGATYSFEDYLEVSKYLETKLSSDSRISRKENLNKYAKSFIEESYFEVFDLLNLLNKKESLKKVIEIKRQMETSDPHVFNRKMKNIKEGEKLRRLINRSGNRSFLVQDYLSKINGKRNVERFKSAKEILFNIQKELTKPRAKKNKLLLLKKKSNKNGKIEWIKCRNGLIYHEAKVAVAKMKYSNLDQINIYVANKKNRDALFEVLDLHGYEYSYVDRIKDYFLIRLFVRLYKHYKNKDLRKFNHFISFIYNESKFNDDIFNKDFLEIINDIFNEDTIKNIKIKNKTNEIFIFSKILKEINELDLKKISLDGVMYYLENTKEINPYYIYKDNRINILYYNQYKYINKLGIDHTYNIYIGLKEEIIEGDTVPKKVISFDNIELALPINNNEINPMSFVKKKMMLDKIRDRRYLEILNATREAILNTVIFDFEEQDINLINCRKEIRTYSDLFIFYQLTQNEA